MQCRRVHVKRVWSCIVHLGQVIRFFLTNNLSLKEQTFAWSLLVKTSLSFLAYRIQSLWHKHVSILWIYTLIQLINRVEHCSTQVSDNYGGVSINDRFKFAGRKQLSEERLFQCIKDKGDYHDYKVMPSRMQCFKRKHVCARTIFS